MQPAQIEKYREKTRAITAIGAAFPTFMCARCHQPKRVAGRKKVGKGYACADCKKPSEEC